MSASGGATHALGIDVGGTKIEALVLDRGGGECWRRRIDSPSGRYDAMLDAIAGLTQAARAALGGATLTIGLGTPGSASADGRIKNANSLCLNGRPLQRDLEARLGKPVRIANDANCLALSEATDGAGAGAAVVFAAILGTGVGAGIAIDHRVLTGPNRLAGEWGHNPLPWSDAGEARVPCWCGQRGCIETLASGPALARDHAARHGGNATAGEIAAAAAAGDADAAASVECWQHRLARALAGVINLLDPDVIVLGGGLSRIASTYARVPALLPQWVFAGGVRESLRTRIVPARWGDSSGVRGAAWLWRGDRAAAGLDRAG